VKNTTKGSTMQGNPVPQALQDIVHNGGIENMLRNEGYLASR
jgi:hypothetical protein